MLALIGLVGDPVCRGVAAAAAAAALSTTRVDGRSSWSISILSGPRWQVRLEGPDGTPTAILNRGLPPFGRLSAAEDSDLLATWWAALATFPGRVLNRPDTSGFLPQVLVPRLAGSVLVTGPDPEPPPGREANVHDVGDGRFSYRLPRPQAMPVPMVRAVTAFDPTQCWRLVLVGDRLIDVALPVRGLTEAERSEGCAAIRTLPGAGTMFALAVLERSEGRMRLVALEPMPRPQHYAGVEAAVHAAVVDWLAA